MEARIQSVRNEVLQHTLQIQEIPDCHTPEKAAIKRDTSLIMHSNLKMAKRRGKCN